ncbi:MAG: 3'-5' exonuclease [Polyangiaceae bacterium]
MSRNVDACGCFPTGRHYAGIAHLLRGGGVRGLVPGLSSETPWVDLPIALLDVETTGRDASINRIVELGIVVGRGGEIIARHNWLVNPGCPIPEEVRAIHGISDDDVRNEPRFEAIAGEIAEALRGSIPAAYNAPFDRAFVTNEFARSVAAGVPAAEGVPAIDRDVDWIDPLVWAREIQKDERSRALGDVAARLGVKLENAHRASDDAEAALHVLYALGKDVRVPKSYGAFMSEQKRIAQKQADERRRWRG